MTLLVVAKMGVSSSLDWSATHKLLVLAGGIRWRDGSWRYGSAWDKLGKSRVSARYALLTESFIYISMLPCSDLKCLHAPFFD